MTERNTQRCSQPADQPVRCPCMRRIRPAVQQHDQRPAAPLQVSEPQPVGRDPALPQQTRHQPIIGRHLRPGTQGTTRCSSGTPGAATSRSCRITTAGTPSASRGRPGSIQRLPRFPGISCQCEHTARLGNRPHVARSPITESRDVVRRMAACSPEHLVMNRQPCPGFVVQLRPGRRIHQDLALSLRFNLWDSALREPIHKPRLS
jgi:hypothetical protein